MDALASTRENLALHYLATSTKRTPEIAYLLGCEDIRPLSRLPDLNRNPRNPAGPLPGFGASASASA
jgi:hypothetical protein